MLSPGSPTRPPGSTTCAAAQFGWSRDVLLNQIKAHAYERAVKEKKSHNFALALPEPLAEQADEILKSRYNFEFLGIGAGHPGTRARRPADRRAPGLHPRAGLRLLLRRAATSARPRPQGVLRRLAVLPPLLEGARRLRPQDRPLRARTRRQDGFLPEPPERERTRPDDAPSIGIILCAEKDDVEVEFALKTKTNPIGVAEYQLQPRLPAELKGELPVPGNLPRSSGKLCRQGHNHGQEIPATQEDRRNPHARRRQAEEHSHGGIPVRREAGAAAPRSASPTSAATAISTRSSSGAARTSRTGATSSSTPRRSTSRRKCIPRC